MHHEFKIGLALAISLPKAVEFGAKSELLINCCKKFSINFVLMCHEKIILALNVDLSVDLEDAWIQSFLAFLASLFQ